MGGIVYVVDLRTRQPEGESLEGFPIEFKNEDDAQQAFEDAVAQSSTHGTLVVEIMAKTKAGETVVRHQFI